MWGELFALFPLCEPETNALDRERAAGNSWAEADPVSFALRLPSTMLVGRQGSKPVMARFRTCNIGNGPPRTTEAICLRCPEIR